MAVKKKAVKKTVSKKVAPKKLAPKKEVAKKETPKKEATKKPAVKGIDIEAVRAVVREALNNNKDVDKTAIAEQVGVSPITIHRFAKDESKTSLDIVLAIAKLIDMEVSITVGDLTV